MESRDCIPIKAVFCSKSLKVKVLSTDLHVFLIRFYLLIVSIDVAIILYLRLIIFLHIEILFYSSCLRSIGLFNPPNYVEDCYSSGHHEDKPHTYLEQFCMTDLGGRVYLEPSPFELLQNMTYLCTVHGDRPSKGELMSFAAWESLKTTTGFEC